MCSVYDCQQFIIVLYIYPIILQLYSIFVQKVCRIRIIYSSEKNIGTEIDLQNASHQPHFVNACTLLIS